MTENRSPFSVGYRDRFFEALDALDDWFHQRGITFKPVCWLVGRLEIGYYDRTTDWTKPLYVDPKAHPELYLKHAADLCAHGYRRDCPEGCASV